MGFATSLATHFDPILRATFVAPGHGLLPDNVWDTDVIEPPVRGPGLEELLRRWRLLVLGLVFDWQRPSLGPWHMEPRVGVERGITRLWGHAVLPSNHLVPPGLGPPWLDALAGRAQAEPRLVEPFLVGDQLGDAVQGGPVDGVLVFETGTQHNLGLFVPMLALLACPGQHLGNLGQSPLGVVVLALLLGRDLAQFRTSCAPSPKPKIVLRNSVFC